MLIQIQDIQFSKLDQQNGIKQLGKIMWLMGSLLVEIRFRWIKE